MLKKRIIPCLLLKGKGFVKTMNFKHPVYLGDPLNIVKIFNVKMIDELMILDITASAEGRKPNFELIQKISSISFSPLTYGGGITSLDEAKRLFSIGIEKICLNTAVFKNPKLLHEINKLYGSQSLIVSLNIFRNFLGSYRIVDNSTKSIVTDLSIPESVKWLESNGAGEILINDVNNDGVMKGYNIDLIKMVTSVSTVPVIACGGCGNLGHIREVLTEGGASAAAVGSFFVFNGKHKAVLLSYPSQAVISNLLKN
ncbi:imidazole glycerol phosphate synthase subunit HisF [Ginsengibacter hankyongi]|uniref:imidazole glycerol-phosphate synthase n=1 Tax=Ginsengibacter hankyongi TaxID=2607284 RepID=A0A5J5IN97_9BACT|nr:AglZ/HisF2 family acetamidino modification protein [Ginsengibacter hankyongi]KAA9041467.1 imidazole glycerol phosphate synthase subunit HisF [Ginsengibacter hankyongi]